MPKARFRPDPFKRRIGVPGAGRSAIQLFAQRHSGVQREKSAVQCGEMPSGDAPDT
jgi:hypothetical protein